MTAAGDDTAILLLRQSRRELGVPLVNAFALVAVGLAIALTAHPFGWVFAGISALVAGGLSAAVVRPTTLALDAEGFTLIRPWHKRRYRWDEASPFFVAHQGRPPVPMVAWSRKTRSKLDFGSLFPTALSAQGFGLQPEAMVGLLNEARAKALGGDVMA